MRFYLSIFVIFISIGLCGCTRDTTVTKEEYEKIKPNMTLSEVTEIVGFEGQRIDTPDEPSQSDAEKLTQSYLWKNPDGAGLIVFFVKDKVLLSRLWSKEELTRKSRTPLPLFPDRQ